jgi:hypothetical protein
MGLFATTKKFIDRQAEIKHAEEFLNRMAALESPTVEGIMYFGIPGIGKSRILQHIASRCRKRALLPAAVDFESLAEHSRREYLLHLFDQLETRQRLREAIRAATDEKVLEFFAQGAQERLKGHPFILLLDSCESCSPELFDWIGRQFLAYLESSRIGPIAFFLASRGPQVAESNWPVHYVRATQNRHVPAFDWASTKKHIVAVDKAKRSRGGEKTIYELSVGHPFSTEALVHFLRRFDVNNQAIAQHRQPLAQQLYDALIENSLLPSTELWPRENFEIVCIPRRFDAALLEKLAPEYSHFWYAARMQELQKANIHLIHVGHGKPAYQLETTLRKLLYVALSILQPQRVLETNAKLQQIYENELQQEALVGRPSAVSLLEMLYHHIQIELLSGRTTNPSAEELLAAKLKAYFYPGQRDDIVQLNQLRDLLAKDMDFLEYLGRPAINQLLKLIDAFIGSPPLTAQQPITVSPPREKLHLAVRHNPPSEYQISWFLEKKPLYPAQTVHTEVKFSIAEWRQNPAACGRVALATYLPLEVKASLALKKKFAIELTTNTMDIPFELMHDEREFLCLTRPIGRHIEMMQAAKTVAPITTQGWRALVVGDPTGNLPLAKEEAETVANLLERQNVTVKRLIGKEQATLKNFVSALVLHQYHLIHYAGHAFFNSLHPSLSGLCLTQDGHEATVTAGEFKRYLNSPSFVFFSACEAAAAEKAAAIFNAQGTLIQNLAVAALEGGACGCLGPMWEIEDCTTKDFAVAFYKFLFQNKPIGEAVRLARRKVRQHPTDCWASWVLFGNPYTHPFGAAPMETRT